MSGYGCPAQRNPHPARDSCCTDEILDDLEASLSRERHGAQLNAADRMMKNAARRRSTRTVPTNLPPAISSLSLPRTLEQHLTQEPRR